MKKHYIISDSGSIIGFTKEDYEMLPEKSRKLFEELGNHFETKKDAELAIKKLKALKRLHDRGFKFAGYNANYEGLGVIYINDYDDGEWNYRDDMKDLDLLFGSENNG